MHPIPDWVEPADRDRWILAEGCARQLFPGNSGAIWAATRVLFRSPRIRMGDRFSTKPKVTGSNPVGRASHSLGKPLGDAVRARVGTVSPEHPGRQIGFQC